MVRSKFNLTASKNEDGSMNVTGFAVTNGCEENKAFNDATPSGNFNMHIAAGKEAQDKFSVGETKEYYIDITPCEVTSDAVDNKEV